MKSKKTSIIIAVILLIMATANAGWYYAEVDAAGPSVISVVQVAAGSADPASATFGSTPAAGNLLLAFGGERSNTTMTSGTITGTGWSKVITHNQTDLSIALWWKVAGASEPTNIQIDNGTAAAKYAYIVEINSSGGGTWGFLAEESTDNGGTDGDTSIATGTTSSTSGTQVIIPICAARNTNTGGGVNGTISFATAGSAASDSDANGNTVFFAIGLDDSTATGTKSDTVTVSTNNLGLIGAIAVFSLTP